MRTLLKLSKIYDKIIWKKILILVGILIFIIVGSYLVGDFAEKIILEEGKIIGGFVMLLIGIVLVFFPRLLS